MLFILGYCEILSDAIGRRPNEQTATNNTNPLPFDNMACHPLSVLNNMMNNKTCSIPSGRSCIPDLWDINIHFEKVQNGRLHWKHVFNFDVYQSSELEQRAREMARASSKENNTKELQQPSEADSSEQENQDKPTDPENTTERSRT